MGAVFLSELIKVEAFNILPFHGPPAASQEYIIDGALILFALVLYQSSELWALARGAWSNLRLARGW